VLANQGFFSHLHIVKRGLKGQYCGNGLLYFAGTGLSWVSSKLRRSAKNGFSFAIAGLPE